ncbi:GntR family transcriptional regulator [Streptomyces minutiscleroticus]|uniref:HTH-type transcriptional repressor YvoA n=1 Tax=Streptomyces minutiscleroticus TaxID=68238 RepID=A0A918NYG1_9ACTN|nr:GntR family transcriptional regulator [Streptomyces minutiscleroticus]GGY06739.1 HTH-type transcriptional repressor YvoA [Streptomyces minutiscleroticus]
MTNHAHPDFAPRYYTIEQALRARIADLQPHDALPSESELAKEFGVSRMTARAAVVRLVADGLVYREPGRGTFVATPPTRRRADSLVRFSQEMRAQGRRPSSRIVSSQTRAARQIELARLRLEPGDQVVAITRVRLADAVPIALERSAFPTTAAGLLDCDLANESLHEALADLGFVPTIGHASLSAGNAGDLEAELLEVEPGVALLVEQRLILDQNGDPLEFTESRYIGDRYALDVTFDVQHDQGPTQP